MSEETLTALLFLTARVAAVLFLPAFAGPARLRRGFTLAFVAAHTIHLGTIGLAAAVLGPARFADPPVLILGAAVYGLIFALGYAAFGTGPPPRLPPRFESFAWYVVWATLARPLVTRAILWKTPVHIAFAIAFLAALAVRLVFWYSHRLRLRARPGGH